MTRKEAVLRSVTPAIGTLLALAVVLLLGVGSLAGAAVAGAAVLMVILLVVAGIEGSAIILLVAGFAFAPLEDLRPVAALTFVNFSDLCLFFAVLLLIPCVIGNRFDLQPAFVIGASGVVATGLISCALSVDPLVSLNAMLRLVVGAFVLPLMFMLWRPRRELLLPTLAVAFVAGNMVNVVYAVVKGVASYENRYLGLTTHPNILGMCALLAVALIPFLLQELPKRFAWMLVAAGLICAYGIWLSGSRAALLVAVLIAVLYPLLARSIEVFIVLFGLAIVPVYIVGKTLADPGLANNIIGRFMGGGSASASDQARQILIDRATTDFFGHPVFGVGFGGALEAHNIYLQIAAAGGIAVLIFYLVLLGAVVRHPLALGERYRLLALPAFAYVLIGPLTPLLWDRYIWCVLALPFLVAAGSRSSTDGGPVRLGRFTGVNVKHIAKKPTARDQHVQHRRNA